MGDYSDGYATADNSIIWRCKKCGWHLMKTSNDFDLKFVCAKCGEPV